MAYSANRAISAARCLSSSSATRAAQDDAANRPTMADDPWAIPLQNPAADPDPNDIPLAHPGGDTAHPEGRDPNEDLEAMRSRLVYQSRKRGRLRRAARSLKKGEASSHLIIFAGTLEMEMLASTFIDAGKLKNMSREEMQEYDMVRDSFTRLLVPPHALTLGSAPDIARLDNLLLGNRQEVTPLRFLLGELESVGRAQKARIKRAKAAPKDARDQFVPGRSSLTRAKVCDRCSIQQHIQPTTRTRECPPRES